MTTFLPRSARCPRSSSSLIPSMDAWRWMFSRTISNPSKKPIRMTNQVSHAVRMTTFSVVVTANTTETATGTAMPKMSAPRFKRG